jgi:hypothetical protein
MMRASLRRFALAISAIALLTLAFMAYLQPAFVVDLANRFMLCF